MKKEDIELRISELEKELTELKAKVREEEINGIVDKEKIKIDAKNAECAYVEGMRDYLNGCEKPLFKYDNWVSNLFYSVGYDTAKKGGYEVN